MVYKEYTFSLFPSAILLKYFSQCFIEILMLTCLWNINTNSFNNINSKTCWCEYLTLLINSLFLAEVKTQECENWRFVRRFTRFSKDFTKGYSTETQWEKAQRKKAQEKPGRSLVSAFPVGFASDFLVIQGWESTCEMFSDRENC